MTRIYTEGQIDLPSPLLTRRGVIEKKEEKVVQNGNYD